MGSSPPPAYTEMAPSITRKPVNSSAPATYQAPPSSTPESSGPHASSSGPWLGPDPRSSSAQSLLPDTSLDAHTPSGDYLGRRKLLIIYIHGFLGNDQSFRSFPAHVHALLANLLVDSHVIHSKIYPRYKTYRAVDVARDNFSEWLLPHESPTTDVILVGHSMGGILAADVVLMPNPSPYGTHPFKHRIIGHISLDCPFLGLHPGIVVSGISSLFKPAPTPPQDGSQGNVNGNNPYGPEASTFADPSVSSLYLTNSQSSGLVSPASPPSIASSSQTPQDPFLNQPFFNQPFFNDSALQERPFVKRMLHFANKYRSEGIIQAAAKHIFSYLEFGSCLADATGLETRYRNIRALEDVDELQSQDMKKDPGPPTARVRFVNYYTLSTGRPKSPKASPKLGTPRAGTDSLSSPKTSLDLASMSASSSSLELDVSPNKVDTKEQSQLHTGHENRLPSITLEHRDTLGNSRDHQTLLDAKAKTLQEQASNATIKGNSFGDDESVTSDINRLSMHSIDPTPIDEDNIPPTTQDNAQGNTHDNVPSASGDAVPLAPMDSSTTLTEKEEADLPPLPDPPTAPELPDPSLYTDKDERKQVEREAKRLRRAHEHALKDHAKAVREREKLVEKRQKRAQKEVEKALKEAAHQEKQALKESQKKGKEAQKEQQRLAKETSEREKKAQEEQEQEHKDEHQQFIEAEEQSQRAAEAEVVAEARDLKSTKPRKLRKFCNVPKDGNRVTDPTWVDIYMADVDEVGAHCGLFFPGVHYEKLVGDVGNRITGWVQDDLTKRAIQEMDM